MESEIKTWLKDIEQAIGEINLFVIHINNFKDFLPPLQVFSPATIRTCYKCKPKNANQHWWLSD